MQPYVKKVIEYELKFLNFEARIVLPQYSPIVRARIENKLRKGFLRIYPLGNSREALHDVLFEP